METLINTSSAAYLTPKASNFSTKIFSFLGSQNPHTKLANGYFPISLSRPFTTQKLCAGLRDSVIVGAKKDHKNKREDTHSFVPKTEEVTGPFPEAVLLKEVLFIQNPHVLSFHVSFTVLRMFPFFFFFLNSHFHRMFYRKKKSSFCFGLGVFESFVLLLDSFCICLLLILLEVKT